MKANITLVHRPNHAIDIHEKPLQGNMTSYANAKPEGQIIIERGNTICVNIVNILAPNAHASIKAQEITCPYIRVKYSMFTHTHQTDGHTGNAIRNINQPDLKSLDLLSNIDQTYLSTIEVICKIEYATNLSSFGLSQ